MYAFVNYLSNQLKEKSLTVVSNGSACVVGSHNDEIKKDARFLINSAIASMGYGLPAAIGACIAADRRETICLEGDGSIMMNLQELQTVLTNQLPIKIFLINGSGISFYPSDSDEFVWESYENRNRTGKWRLEFSVL